MVRRSPVVAIGAGVVAGAAGTLAMDLLWYRRLRRAGGDEGFLDWELSVSTEGFDGAPAPARVGNRLWQLVSGRPLPDERAAATNNVVHWATGIQWAVLYALVARRLGGAREGDGVVLGSVACATAYALLPALGVYRPVWEYDVGVLIDDLQAHLVFGTVTAATVGLLDGTRRSRRTVC